MRAEPDPDLWLAGLRADLEAPPFSAPMSAVAAGWAMRIVTVVCQRPDGLEDYPDLSLRLRGAVGRQLRLLPPPRRWHVRLPSPEAVLFAPVALLPTAPRSRSL